MRITECLWLDSFVDKIIRKHGVFPEEIEDIFSGNAFVRRLEGGHVKGEDLYVALGRSAADRYLSVLFVRKKGGRALIISARDIDQEGKKTLWEKKKNLNSNLTKMPPGGLKKATWPITVNDGFRLNLHSI